MKQLLLLRHAKSSWSDPALVDFDRPLNHRGRKAAQDMAVFLSQERPLPDTILCSTAQRTRQTLMALLDIYCHPIQIEMRRDLYHAEDQVILNMIQGVKHDPEVLMMIGHNPGLEDVAHLLCHQGDAEALREMCLKFPTAACAHIRFDVEQWRDITAQSGQLKSFIKPRDL
ncbi:histidine phosphatase family protein [Terasakiella sp. SH-1]|uniref:SixA phosphatase family protein n=1 Tax=Terasakiella sp. SH-1 TaxID=2560057 RepID=UPI0010741D26|nr:histidine phosphatase family protein [Terasakiella sp. SH-1]